MKVFLSYSSMDQQFADQLRLSFEELGVSVQDPASMSAGADWGGWVRTQLEQSDAVLLIVPSSGSPGANNAFFEVGAANALGKPVMAVVPESERLPAGGLPVDLASRQVLDGWRRPPKAIAADVIDVLQAA